MNLRGMLESPLRAASMVGATVRARVADRDLGSAILERTGEFRIAAPAEPPGAPGAAASAGPAATATAPPAVAGPVTVRVEFPDGTVVDHTVADPVGGDLRIPLPEVATTAADWQALAEAIAHHGITSVHEIVRDLSGRSVLAPDAPILRRAAMVGRLEAGFLDPDGRLAAAGLIPRFAALRTPEAGARLTTLMSDVGDLADAARLASTKLASYLDLYEAVWPIDARALRQGELGAAMARVQDALTSLGRADASGERLQDRYAGYRDYLLAIWTELGADNFPGDPAARTRAREQLEARFHQSFVTRDDALRPVLELLIETASRIMVAPSTNGWGLGMATVPSQGSQDGAAYLAQLIAAADLSRAEYGKRFRLRLDRDPDARSSAVRENIHTLQRFFRDDFQHSTEPNSIIPPRFRGWSPFFLEYDEWLRQTAPFRPENYWHAERSFDTSTDLADVPTMFAQRPTVTADLKQRVADRAAILTALREGHRAFALGQFAVAEAAYARAAERAYHAMLGTDFWDYVEFGVIPSPYIGNDRPRPEIIRIRDKARGPLLARRAATIQSMAELLAFEERYHKDIEEPEAMALGLLVLCATGFPALFGDCALAQGRWADAVRQYGRGLPIRFVLGLAELMDTAGYAPGSHAYARLELHTDGAVPYTLATTDGVVKRGSERWHDVVARPQTPSLDASAVIRDDLHHRIEERFYQQRTAMALLEWADELYRTDQAAERARAVELYKAVLLLHGTSTGFDSHWPSQAGGTGAGGSTSAGGTGAALGVALAELAYVTNPVARAQVERAREALARLAAGLNYHGFADDVVPLLRGEPLLDSADRFAALARSAQGDFQGYLGASERLLTDELQRRFVVTRAGLQQDIAREQEANAKVAIDLAKVGVQQVNEAIAAKQKEIDDHADFWGQVGDFFSGMGDAIKGVAGVGGSALSSGGSAAATQLGGVGGTAAGGGAVLGGYALFVYAGVTSMNAMNDAQSRRKTELATLKTRTLVAAQAAVTVRERELKIASLQGQVAAAESAWAAEWAAFDGRRVLGQRYYAEMIALTRRLMRRYLDVGARLGWLAERALAYELARPVAVMQLDYFPEVRQGIGGADRLIADLAELRARRLDLAARPLRLRRSVSLLREHPFDLMQLRGGGKCGFRTTGASFAAAYPGTYGHRIRGVEVEVVTTDPSWPVRGVVRNDGHSQLARRDGTLAPSVRFPDLVPIGDPISRSASAAGGAATVALAPLEGSGVDTAWEVVLPRAANPHGLHHVADVILHLDVDASAPATGAVPGDAAVARTHVVSGRYLAPATIAALRGSATTAELTFDLPAVLGRDRGTIAALVIFTPGHRAVPLTVDVRTTAPAATTRVSVVDGVHVSSPTSPLAALLGATAAQPVTLTVTKPAGLDLSALVDVVLAVEVTPAP